LEYKNGQGPEFYPHQISVHICIVKLPMSVVYTHFTKWPNMAVVPKCIILT